MFLDIFESVPTQGKRSFKEERVKNLGEERGNFTVGFGSLIASQLNQIDTTCQTVMLCVGGSV